MRGNSLDGTLVCILTYILVSLPIAVEADNFTFAVVADPQVSARDGKGKVALNAQKDLEQVCRQISAINPMPDFTIFLGDLVNVFEPHSVNNFRECILPLRSPLHLTHGNHDTNPPYTDFISLHREYNNHLKSINYSFVHKGWFFVTLPSEFELPQDILKWLDGELVSHKDMPTVLLSHFPLLPVGLSQLEFYTYTIPTRNALMSIITRYGNVRYCFSGHVHNGIKTSEKTRWRYKNIDFVIVPTVISPRPFEEELDEFGLDNRGGFFITATTDGNKIHMQGRRANTSAVYKYKSKVRKFDTTIEPRWFSTISEIQGNSKIGNFDFSEGMRGWRLKYRYGKDSDSTSYCRILKEGADLFVRSSLPDDWADDEYNEIYRIEQIDPNAELCLNAEYRVIKFGNGGGFIRVTAFDAQNEPYLFIFHWGENQADASYLPRCMGFELYGKNVSWNFLREMGENRRAFYVRLDVESGKEQSLNINLGNLYDMAVGTKSAFCSLAISKVYLGAGVWANKNIGAVSQSIFSNINIGEKLLAPMTNIDYKNIYNVDFGLALDNRVKARQKTEKKK